MEIRFVYVYKSKTFLYTLIHVWRTNRRRESSGSLIVMYKWFHRILTTLWRREIECWTERDEVGYEWCVYVLVRSCCFALIRNQYQKVTLTIIGCYDGRSRVRCSWLIYLAWVHTFGINLLVSGKIVVVDRCVLVRESWQLLSFCLRLGKRENLCEKLNLGSHSLDVRTMVRFLLLFVFFIWQFYGLWRFFCLRFVKVQCCNFYFTR